MDDWPAAIALDFRRQGARTALVRRHLGPLRVQKALYPEGEGVCHAVLLHPPGGIAGGDRLRVEVAVGEGARGLVTTPGAGKWYKSAGRTAGQTVRLRVEGGLEWLPQEAIVFDAAEARADTEIELGPRARALGWDIVVLGRTAAGEHFRSGSYQQTIRLRQGGELVWIERTRLAGGDRLLDSPVGMAGNTSFGCLWAAGPDWSDACLEALRQDAGPAALTRVAPRLLLARVLGAGAAPVRAALEAAWERLRPRVFEGAVAVRPRIWAT